VSFADAIELRDHLADILAPYLGEWEDSTPRIHIVPPTPKLGGKAAADTATNSALECIIRRVPDGDPTQLSAGQRAKISVYRVELVNFGDDTKLSSVISILDEDSKLNFARPRVYMAANRSLGAPEQAVFYPRVSQIINQSIGG
jgi:ABC-type uncharacterized transport system YnjBCD ATPase subunit